MKTETVKDILNSLLELNDFGTNLWIDGKEASIEDYKECNSEALYKLCELLGF